MEALVAVFHFLYSVNVNESSHTVFVIALFFLSAVTVTMTDHDHVRQNVIYIIWTRMHIMHIERRDLSFNSYSCVVFT